MIISPPFLPLKDTPVYSEEDVRFLMPDAAPGNGFFPVSQAMAWHGGMHFSATSAQEPVRAIADGVVIFKRDAELARYDLQDHSTGCVVLRHTTEIGAQGNTATEVVFYSIYQHLRALDKDLPTVGQTIYRKDKLGLAGFVHGVANRIHLEIIAGDADAQKLLGRSTGDLDLTRDGRTDSVYGQIYVLLPAQSPCYASDPRTASNPAPAGNSGPDRLIIGIQYAMGQAILTTYQLTGKTLGSPVPEADAEYNLYVEATRRHNNLRANLQAGGNTDALPDSSPSGWYELLRFGRNLGPDPLPSNAAHWRQVALPGQAGAMWVDLNAAGTKKFSDADFPQWMGWKLVDDDSEDGNSQCNSALIDVMLSPLAQPQTAPSLTGPTSPAPETAQTTPAQKAANRLRSLADMNVQQQLAKAICKFPTEWADAEVRTRWAWVRKPGNPHIPYPLEEEIDFTEMSEFAQKLCFWEKLPDEDKNRLTMKHWHFNAREFIVHFRKCGWLSYKEFIQSLPKSALRIGKDKISQMTGSLWEPIPNLNAAENNPIIVNHLLPLNRMMQKYLISTPIRKTTFFGNAIQETAWLGSLSELGGGEYWYAPWFGRGFLQLTHASNYISYWIWRGHDISTNLQKNLVSTQEKEQIKKPSERDKSAMKDINFPEITPSIIAWRNAVLGGPQLENSPEKFLAPSDSAGFYWASLKMAQYSDEKHIIERIEVNTVNRQGTKIYYRSPSFWKASAAVNLPASINKIYSSALNGFDSRCCAYGYALATLTEVNFPNKSGDFNLEFPEGYEKRKIQ